ncbi:MAG TPA: hydroxyacid-oxoacid transhydrogenase [Rhodocyclaceae bacterium]|nr:hydroxyacid-oxoacid transhydrogenase [Rhodocyclaceae bacterium]HRQ47323.1 hydroxyacid-oxoacid transhydrogenase [Rhodocyclaceae bacterium]
MSCCHHYALAEGGDAVFSVDISAITFGPGCLAEAGDHARNLGLKRVALFTDPRLADMEHAGIVRRSLADAGLDAVVYSDVTVEPTDKAFVDAARFVADGHFDGFVSVGGGSVIDTAKAANLYSTYPAELAAYVNAPLGEGRAVPGPLKPHIACPTTCGTGAECTGIAIFDWIEKAVKTGIVSRRLRPTLALIDPTTTYTLPATVVAASGFDVLSHALESYTALPHTCRAKAAQPSLRPMSQGANPWSDFGCEKALQLTGTFLERAVRDAADREARDAMMWAATLAGIAFGNAGVHLPHGMAYAVAGGVRDFRVAGYPQEEPMVPHGMSVIVNAPAVFRFTADACPERHLDAAAWLGADVHDATTTDAGEIVARRLIDLMRICDIPNGVGGVGYHAGDIGTLTAGAWAQQRLVKNAPKPVAEEHLADLFRNALSYW